MKYEQDRKEFFKERICEASTDISELLDKGYQVEICRSRSGIKIYSVTKKHYVLKKGGFKNA